MEIFVCSYGVVNCPICMRPRKLSASAQAQAMKRGLVAIYTAIAERKVRVTVRNGEVHFDGIDAMDRAGMQDIEIYRNIQTSGSALAKAAVAQAERLGGPIKDSARHTRTSGALASRVAQAR